MTNLHLLRPGTRTDSQQVAKKLLPLSKLLQRRLGCESIDIGLLHQTRQGFVISLVFYERAEFLFVQRRLGQQFAAFALASICMN